MMLQEFPVLDETQIAVLKAVIGALHQDQVLTVLLFVNSSTGLQMY